MAPQVEKRGGQGESLTCELSWILMSLNRASVGGCLCLAGGASGSVSYAKSSSAVQENACSGRAGSPVLGLTNGYRTASKRLGSPCCSWSFLCTADISSRESGCASRYAW